MHSELLRNWQSPWEAVRDHSRKWAGLVITFTATFSPFWQSTDSQILLKKTGSASEIYPTRTEILQSKWHAQTSAAESKFHINLEKWRSETFPKLLFLSRFYIPKAYNFFHLSLRARTWTGFSARIRKPSWRSMLDKVRRYSTTSRLLAYYRIPSIMDLKLFMSKKKLILCEISNF